MKKIKQPVFSLRMPATLKLWFEGEAIHNKRSVNAEILIRLEDAYEKETGRKIELLEN